MKRLIPVIILLVTGLVQPVFSQNTYYGVIGGINFSDMNIVEEGNAEIVYMRHAFGAGGVFGLRITDHFYLRTEPMFVEKGGILFPDGDDKPYIELMPGFFEFPLFIEAAVGDKVRLYGLAGPVLSLLLSAEGNATFQGYDLTVDYKKIIETVGLGIDIGAGVRFPLGWGWFFVEGRFEFGVSNINKGGTMEFRLEDVPAISDEIDESLIARTKGIQVMAGMVLPFSRE